MTACRLADTCIVPHGVSRDVVAPPPPLPPLSAGGGAFEAIAARIWNRHRFRDLITRSALAPAAGVRGPDRVSSPDPGVVRRDAVFIIF